METTEIIRMLRQCGDCCRSSCEECPDYQKAEEGFHKDPDAKGFMWRCGGVLLDAADRLEELSELLNEWEPVVHGKVEALVVHGHNTYDHDSAFECSVCGFSDWDTMTADCGRYNYCPNCGAHMDEEVADGR